MVNFDRAEFIKMYKVKEDFLESKYFLAFTRMLEDEELLRNIRFANDYLEIAPVECWFQIDKKLFNEKITDNKLKQYIGACFGYLYRFVYGNYEVVRCNVRKNVSGISKSAYFEKIDKE